ncbi:DUF3953 domain-containing protein [Alkalihalobacterium sp. APHAB7]|uniref:DUF3953 domain-containing protein n=1 Tax=Alkalihalobacterium sp. APHAB7 TaxID=3402081 RepID=UPI003AAFE6A0
MTSLLLIKQTKARTYLGGETLLKVLRLIFLILIVTLGGYMLLNPNFDLMPYLLYLLGVFSFVLGLIELKKDRKSFGGYVNISASAFIIFVAILLQYY